MSPSDGFLARWSRRKLDARAEEAEARLPSDAEPTGADQAAPVPAGEPPTSVAELSDEELAALPRIEDLTAETGLAPFLRAGVPALLRKAALRRMWSLDPAIRDFVGEARDYSYDWNVPGGVPVSGPLLPGDDIEATLGRMFSRLRDDPESEAEPASGQGSVAEASPPPEEMPDPDAPSRTDEDGIAEPPGLLAEDIAPASKVLANVESDTAAPDQQAGAPLESSRPPSPSRRHGAARPKFDSF